MMSTGSRSRTPTPRREAVEADLLRALNELLAEGASYTDLDVGRIAQRAGISRTAFYFYFADKRELLKRVTDEVVELLYAEADRWWSGVDGPADLDEVLRNAAALYRAHAVVLRAIVEVSGYDTEIGDFWRAVIGRFVDATTHRLEQEWGPGPHSPPASTTAYVLSWMTERTFYEALVEDGDEHWGPLLDAVVAVWHRTIYGPR